MRSPKLVAVGLICVLVASVVAGVLWAHQRDGSTVSAAPGPAPTTSPAPSRLPVGPPGTTGTTSTSGTTSTTSTTRPAPRSFTLAATGDFLIHAPVFRQAGVNAGGVGYDFAPMLVEVTPILSAADLALCHVEVPLSADNTDLAGYPVFSAPHELAGAVAAAGYDSCSTVSNHALDRGPAGVTATLDALDRAGVRHAGTARSAAEDATPALLEAGGVRVAHLAYAYGFNGFAPPADAPWLVNQIDPAAILAEAGAARAAGAEFVVVSLQWGAEYQQAPTADQQALAQELLSSPDVDLIIGHHVHVVQPVGRVPTGGGGGAEGPEVSKVVAYGLGNFLSNQSIQAGLPASTQDGVILSITVTETAPGILVATDVSFTPTFVDRGAGYVIRPVDAATNPDSYHRTVQAIGALGAEGVHPDR